MRVSERPCLWALVCYLAWALPLVLNYLLGTQSHPFLLFFVYLFPCLWYAAPYPAAFSLLFTIACCSALDQSRHADALVYTLSGDVIILLVGALIIHARRQARAQQARTQRLLTDEAEARVQADQALLLRDEFLTAASHDLRTPLTGILGRAELMQMRLARGGALDPDWLQAQVAALYEAGLRLRRIIQDVTDAAMLTSERPIELALQALDLAALCQQVGAAVRDPAGPWRRADCAVRGADRPLLVLADRTRLERVVQNLVDNAVRYSAPETPIQITLSHDTRRALIAITDHGQGIPPADLAHVFERYYRASNAARHRGGTGIGLAAARRLITLHGGDLWLCSTLGQGTTAWITLPLHPAPEYH